MSKQWIFNWNSGGYNVVSASTRKEALIKAREKGVPHPSGFKGLTVNEVTLREVTTAELIEIDSKYRGMFD